MQVSDEAHPGARFPPPTTQGCGQPPVLPAVTSSGAKPSLVTGRAGLPLCPCIEDPRLNSLSFSSKTALLEGLEVDQYMWGILNAIQQ